MKYQSTRSTSNQELSFEEAVIEGLAPDGGLFVPVSIPALTKEDINSWKDFNFLEISCRLFRKFIDSEEISDWDLKSIVSKSFASFSSPKVTPLVHLSNELWILELFHGPTFAFKDVALQILGNLFEFFLRRKGNAALNIIGATSGDTGGAAIYGLRGKKGIQTFILHPMNRISPIQEEQMTTVLDSNIHNIAVEGTFDDCQEIVKTLFSDIEFKRLYSLGSVNSINWARIMAQMSYYFFSYFEIQRLMNSKGQECKIAYRFLQTGYYEKVKTGSGFEDVKQTLSPAMDILISSNFERLLYHLLSRIHNSHLKASDVIIQYMNDLKSNGKFKASIELLNSVSSYFVAYRATDEETVEAIRRYYYQSFVNSSGQHGYILDPHTAVGVVAAENNLKNSEIRTHTIVLGTASPGKFPDAIISAINDNPPEEIGSLGFKPVVFEDFAPEILVNLKGLPKRCIQIRTNGEFGKAIGQVRMVIQQLLQ